MHSSSKWRLQLQGCYNAVHRLLVSCSKRQSKKVHMHSIQCEGNSKQCIAAAKRRLLWTLSSGSLVFRSHLFSEWYEDRIQPSMHYLPVRLSEAVHM